MRKLSNRLKKLLIRYHSVMGDNSLTDSVRERRLKKIKCFIAEYHRSELKGVATALSESSGHPMVFRIWCELINLTGGI